MKEKHRALLTHRWQKGRKTSLDLEKEQQFLQPRLSASSTPFSLPKPTSSQCSFQHAVSGSLAGTRHYQHQYHCDPGTRPATVAAPWWLPQLCTTKTQHEARPGTGTYTATPLRCIYKQQKAYFNILKEMEYSWAPASLSGCPLCLILWATLCNP